MSRPPDGAVCPRDFEDLVGLLRPLLAGRAVIVGIGRADLGDDGFGPEVVRQLRGRTDLVLIDAGVAPENFLGRILAGDPQSVLLVDAADLGAAPGTLALLPVRDGQPPSTHGLSLRLLVEFLEGQGRCRCHLLAAQPAPGVRAGMTSGVRDAAAAVAACVAALRPVERAP